MSRRRRGVLERSLENRTGVPPPSRGADRQRRKQQRLARQPLQIVSILRHQAAQPVPHPNPCPTPTRAIPTPAPPQPVSRSIPIPKPKPIASHPHSTHPRTVHHPSLRHQATTSFYGNLQRSNLAASFRDGSFHDGGGYRKRLVVIRAQSSRTHAGLVDPVHLKVRAAVRAASYPAASFACLFLPCCLFSFDTSDVLQLLV